MEAHCLYTSQGEIVCNKNIEMEPFVNEQPNMKNVDISGNILADAISKNYCEILAMRNSSTGEMQYNFKKECKK
jgi:hypothetical protein